MSLQAIEAGKHVYSEKPLATTVADGVAIVEAAQRESCASARRRTPCSAPPSRKRAADRRRRDRQAAGGTRSRAVARHGALAPDPGFFFRAGAGPVFDMGPYYLSALVTLLGPVASVQATGQIGFEERIVTAPELAVPRAIDQGGDADRRPRTARFRVRRPRHVHGELGRLETRRSANRIAWTTSVAPRARPQLVRRRLVIARQGPGMADAPHRRQDLRREKLAGGRPEICELPWARPSRHGARDHRHRPHRANGDDRPACARGHGGDSRGGHQRSAM